MAAKTNNGKGNTDERGNQNNNHYKRILWAITKVSVWYWVGHYLFVFDGIVHIHWERVLKGSIAMDWLNRIFSSTKLYQQYLRSVKLDNPRVVKLPYNTASELKCQIASRFKITARSAMLTLLWICMKYVSAYNSQTIRWYKSVCYCPNHQISTQAIRQKIKKYIFNCLLNNDTTAILNNIYILKFTTNVNMEIIIWIKSRPLISIGFGNEDQKLKILPVRIKKDIMNTLIVTRICQII